MAELKTHLPSTLAICVVETFKGDQCLGAYAMGFRAAREDLGPGCLLVGERAVLSFWDFRDCGPWLRLQPYLIAKVEYNGTA